MSVFEKMDRALVGQPNSILTAALLIVAAIALLAAFYAKPSIKAAVATWFVLP